MDDSHIKVFDVDFCVFQINQHLQEIKDLKEEKVTLSSQLSEVSQEKEALALVKVGREWGRGTV